eukprot:gnl/MRDRNA2_/MRDRNA2_77776_c0_seq1.p1 gnl/MRDRNA2_/MRDRNA2_77776_c0~~gnl/MRDRNA2_/MRDRNA2_77776_c0_seq1.p1  ORF type:complete len:267 (+),score=21.01 gnl/MRDRNA2_/MRDRNA2_77776_c0_seq1:58-858(+)
MLGTRCRQYLRQCQRWLLPPPSGSFFHTRASSTVNTAFRSADLDAAWPGSLELTFSYHHEAGLLTSADFSLRPWVIRNPTPAELFSRLRHAALMVLGPLGDTRIKVEELCLVLIFLDELQLKAEACRQGGISHTARYDELLTRPWILHSSTQAETASVVLWRYRTSLNPRDRLLVTAMAPPAAMLATRLGGTEERQAVWKLGRRSAIGPLSTSFLGPEDPWEVSLQDRYEGLLDRILRGMSTDEVRELIKSNHVTRCRELEIEAAE